MRVAVLGGGMQGCCAALALAARGASVTLFDRSDRLFSRAAVANEGKIHLGYMYANDPTFATARTMIRGALSFAPFLARHLGIDPAALQLSDPAAYVVHRDSQRTPAEVAAYLEDVHRMIGEAAAGDPGCYFGRDLAGPLRRWSDGERNVVFDGGTAVAAFDSPEVAINPLDLAARFRERIAAEERITLRLGEEVLAVEDCAAPAVVLRDGEGVRREGFDHVVNALWEGRLAIDATLGFAPSRPWLHRLKYGVSFRRPEPSPPLRSATFVSGPFGEVVNYRDGLVYLTWYPVCLTELSRETTPPFWATHPCEPERSRLIAGTVAAMAAFIPALRDLDATALPEATARGGAIVAWGSTDIYDAGSELHRRFEIGITTHGRYHSVDPGKLTMAPWFGEGVADRILGSGG
jgi:glycine/D-amino acid oxidase-like deaminating enzyme